MKPPYRSIEVYQKLVSSLWIDTAKHYGVKLSQTVIEALTMETAISDAYIIESAFSDMLKEKKKIFSSEELNSKLMKLMSAAEQESKELYQKWAREDVFKKIGEGIYHYKFDRIFYI